MSEISLLSLQTCEEECKAFFGVRCSKLQNSCQNSPLDYFDTLKGLQKTFWFFAALYYLLC